MCGITIFLSKFEKNIIDELLQSLKIIQNRGYDSVGISYILNNNYHIKKFASTETTDIGHVTQVLEYNEPRKTANSDSYKKTAETTTDLGTNVWVPSVNTNNYSAASVEQPQVQQSLRTPHLSLVANDDLKTLDSYFTNTGGATLANARALVSWK